MNVQQKTARRVSLYMLRRENVTQRKPNFADVHFGSVLFDNIFLSKSHSQEDKNKQTRNEIVLIISGFNCMIRLPESFRKIKKIKKRRKKKHAYISSSAVSRDARRNYQQQREATRLLRPHHNTLARCNAGGPPNRAPLTTNALSLETHTHTRENSVLVYVPRRTRGQPLSSSARA